MDKTDNGVGWLLFAMLYFAIAAVSFAVLVVLVQVWLAATIGLRLTERAWIRAGLWTCVLAPLLVINATVWLR